MGQGPHGHLQRRAGAGAGRQAGRASTPPPPLLSARPPVQFHSWASHYCTPNYRSRTQPTRALTPTWAAPSEYETLPTRHPSGGGHLHGSPQLRSRSRPRLDLLLNIDPYRDSFSLLCRGTDDASFQLGAARHSAPLPRARWPLKPPAAANVACRHAATLIRSLIQVTWLVKAECELASMTPRHINHLACGAWRIA